MLPSRGLRPVQYITCASPTSAYLRRNVSRQFSSFPRTIAPSSQPRRSIPLQSTQWRTSTIANSQIALNTSSVRHGSWYAPWSWGQSSTPAPQAEAGTYSPTSHEFAPEAQPVVTSYTPELAPAGIDKEAVVDGTWPTTSPPAETVEELLTHEPVRDTMPYTEVDPTQAIQYAGQLKDLGLDYGWGGTAMFEHLIESVYLSSGWGWPASIVISGVVVRFFIFFFQCRSSDKMAVMASLGPITAPIQEKLKAARDRGDSAQVDMLKMQMTQVMQPYVGNVFSTMSYVVIQGWIGFCAFRCLRAMAALPVPGMDVDGFMWITDLTIRDPYFIIPITTTAIMAAVFKAGGETGVKTNAGPMAQNPKILTTLAVFIGLVTAFQASGLQLYFLVSSVLSALTAWLLRQNGFRRAVRIRTLPTRKSDELYSKVVKGEATVADIKSGKIRYQAPTKPTLLDQRHVVTLPGIKVKAGTNLPAHLKPTKEDLAKKIDPDLMDRDDDYEFGARGSIGARVSYFRRNYNPKYMWRRSRSSLLSWAKRNGWDETQMTRQQAARKKKAEDYDIERRRRFENRK